MKRTPCPEGSRMLVERDANHRYTIDGVRVPGVTEVISTVLLPDNPVWYTDEARNRGTYVHKICELYDRGTLVLEKVPDDYLGYLFAWRQFLRDTGYKVTGIEVMLGHPLLRYAGQIDRLGVLPDGPTLAEIKTGEPQPWHQVQTGAYESMCDEHMLRLAVYLNANGRYKVNEHTGYDDRDAFVAALSVWNWREKSGLN